VDVPWQILSKSSYMPIRCFRLVIWLPRLRMVRMLAGLTSGGGSSTWDVLAMSLVD